MRVTMALSREIEVLELKGQIESRAEKEMTDAQRQYVLRQQLKAIQSELGEGDGEAQELRKRVQEAELPEHVNTVALREVERLERMTPASPEYQMIRTYLDWILDVPWAKITADRLDPVEARRVLDEDHYDLDKVKERIVEYLAVRKLKGDLKGPILCFVGPPGVGKTSLGQSIARAMNRKFVRISLGGVRDEAEIRGHRRTYIGSMPGRLVQALKTAGSANPVFMLDEIDKIAVGIQGDPAAALLEVLDPAQNHTFRDHYLEIPIDLSKVLFIATANQLGTIHPALLDRMELISLSGYTEEDKVHIARMYLIPRQRDEHGLKRPGQAHRRCGPPRDLRVHARSRRPHARTADRDDHAESRREGRDRRGTHRDGRCEGRADYLGPARFRSEAAFRTSRPGVATGLAWTEAGGDVLFIEAVLMPGGGGRLTLTGQLGNVMQESARAALSHVRQQAERAAHRAGLPEQAGPARPRPGGRDPEGRTVGGRDDGDRDRLGGAKRAGAVRRRDDRRDHALGTRAAGRRHPREGARRAAPRHQDGHPAARERGGPRGTAARRPQGNDVRAGAHARRSAGDLDPRRCRSSARRRGAHRRG